MAQAFPAPSGKMETMSISPRTEMGSWYHPFNAAHQKKGGSKGVCTGVLANHFKLEVPRSEVFRYKISFSGLKADGREKELSLKRDREVCLEAFERLKTEYVVTGLRVQRSFHSLFLCVRKARLSTLSQDVCSIKMPTRGLTYSLCKNLG